MSKNARLPIPSAHRPRVGRQVFFPPNAGESAVVYTPAKTFRPQPSRTAADSFEFGKMSVGNSDSFQASCPFRFPSPAQPVTLFLAGGTKRGGVMRKGCWSEAKPAFLRCVFLSVTGDALPVGDEVAEYTQLFRPVKAVDSKFLVRFGRPNETPALRRDWPPVHPVL